MRMLCVLFAFFTTGLFAQHAPELQNISAWIPPQAITLQSQKGHVILVDFWDYSCINCIRTLPHIEGWYKKYKDLGFEVIGVHTPEFAFEHKVDNVKAAVAKFGITYPVALDNDYATWRAYNNSAWPTSYLINKEGSIVFKHVGEGNYTELENAIRQELGLARLEVAEELPINYTQTHELYLGSERANSADPVQLTGSWKQTKESITSTGQDAAITLNFFAKSVYLVLSGKSSESITVELDGKFLSNITMDGDRKYDILELKTGPSSHTVTIRIPEGVSAYSFTFG